MTLIGYEVYVLVLLFLTFTASLNVLMGIRNVL